MVHICVVVSVLNYSGALCCYLESGYFSGNWNSYIILKLPNPKLHITLTLKLYLLKLVQEIIFKSYFRTLTFAMRKYVS